MFDIIIIGSGTAGMTAAIYALRNNKKVLLIESTAVGGQIAFSPKVENFPSYRSISGEEFSHKLFEQVLDLGASFELEEVIAVEKEKDDTFLVTTDCGTHKGKSVIIATGVKQKHIGIEAEEKLLGKGVYYCAICDGAFYKGKEVAVVGDGNSALQSAILLSSICSKVHVLTWFDKFFGDLSLVDNLRSLENVIITPNTEVIDFAGKDSLDGVVIRRKEDGTVYTLNVPAIFVAIGQLPDNDKFKKLVDLDEQGYLLADEAMKTKTAGLFVAGDCRKKAIRQLTTAASDGAIAAMSAIEYIGSLK